MAAMTLRDDDPLAVSLVAAIHGGAVDALAQLLEDHPRLTQAQILDSQGEGRTPLHIATDWPGHFPNGAAVVATLLDAGADPNAPMQGCWHTETPLHWAASSDDVDVLDALIDAGADIDAAGGSINGGTPMDDAVAYGQWNAARRLAQRGATTEFWHAAALGLTSMVQWHLDRDPPPPHTDITAAFWHACHGGAHTTAEHLLTHGADINWIPPWAHKTPLDIARDAGWDHVHRWLAELGAVSAAGSG